MQDSFQDDRLRAELRQRFVRWLPQIQRALRRVAVGRRLDSQETEDYQAFSYYKLVERNYAVVERFRDECSLDTYLHRVAERLLIDFRRDRWGKWRPSAAAKRLGTTAVQLEKFLYRDGIPLREAVATLKTVHPASSSTGLYSLAGRIPTRLRQGLESLGPELVAAASFKPTEVIDADRRRTLRDKLRTALRSALDELDPEDRETLLLYFRNQRMPMIAERFGRPAKELYRRKDRLLKQLRTRLERDGIGWGQVREIEGRASGEILISDVTWRKPPGPSRSTPNKRKL